MNCLPALPIVPPRLCTEALGSWLERVAAVYEVDAHHLLDEWIAPLPAVPRQQRMTVEIRLTPEHLQTITSALRLPLGAIEPSSDLMATWLLHSDCDAAVCPYCLLQDDQHRRARHRRMQWIHAWQVTCEAHGQPLIHLPGWSTADLQSWKRKEVSQRTALGRPASQACIPARANARHPPVAGALRALRQIERTIGSALAGRNPRGPDWGGLNAQAFLRVVRDVTTFVLTRFGDRSGPPICTMDLGRFMDRAPVRCFAQSRSQRLDPPGHPVDLVWAGHVGLRRCALFWTRELMHARTARPWLVWALKSTRSERQMLILRRQGGEGLAWLAARMGEWPQNYRLRWWSRMGELAHP